MGYDVETDNCAFDNRDALQGGLENRSEPAASFGVQYAQPSTNSLAYSRNPTMVLLAVFKSKVVLSHMDQGLNHLESVFANLP